MIREAVPGPSSRYGYDD